ncbi:hypothetical protein [Caenispirillum bisanense]|uniref:hypothetical protein n=1 Tax=Caenispirillum bisanense TaxID=414052 RepID=UPI0031DA0A5C
MPQTWTLTTAGRPLGRLHRQGDRAYVLTAAGPALDLLDGTRHGTPDEALQIVRAHLDRRDITLTLPAANDTRSQAA